jgi:3-hydroxyanthranilate 3,4-dioxygenase
MTQTAFSALNFKHWIDEHRHLLKPPVGNKQVWKDGEFIVMVVGGPNQRSDFHYNPTPEFFYQLEGDMNLRIRHDGQFQDIPIREGEIFLLPSGIPHSPQRKADTVGLVIEQRRPEGAEDGLIWFCESCGHPLYTEMFRLTNVETQFPPVFDRFYSSEAHRTCSRCGWVMPPRT